MGRKHRSVCVQRQSVRFSGVSFSSSSAHAASKPLQTRYSCLKNLYSRADMFGVDLYAAGLGEQIEGMVKELYAGPGAVRKTPHKYVQAR
mgnify:CR=1 FL=1